MGNNPSIFISLSLFNGCQHLKEGFCYKQRIRSNGNKQEITKACPLYKKMTKYSGTSVARTLMARLPRLFRARS